MQGKVVVASAQNRSKRLALGMMGQGGDPLLVDCDCGPWTAVPWC